jgi:hypothetical protein
MAIEVNDPHRRMKDELVEQTRRRQAEHVERQLTNQATHDKAASEKTRVARSDGSFTPSKRDREYYSGH